MKTEHLASLVVKRLIGMGSTVATAESCTGGGIGYALTAVSGSSAVYSGGIISYTNAVKEQLLSVPASILQQFGAVSPETAAAMASGVRECVSSDFGISVTGLAGPNGDGSGKPVGLVYIGISSQAGTSVEECNFSGDRKCVREQAVDTALELLLSVIS